MSRHFRGKLLIALRTRISVSFPSEAEHWIIVKGTALVTLGDEVLTKKTDEHVFIPVETKHRIENATDSDVEFIEVQAGDNLDENDIVRLEDVYGRV